MGKLTAEQIADIVERRGACEQVEALGAEFGVTASTICYHCRGAAAARFAEGQTAHRARLREQYEDGATISDLAEEHQLTPTTVRVRLARAGATLRKAPPKDLNSMSADIVRLYRDKGRTQEAVAELLGVSAASVHRILKKAGVPTRQRP